MSWDPFQQEVLAELGHVLYRQAGVGVVDETVHVEAPRMDDESIDRQMLTRVARAADMSVEAVQARIGDMQAIAGLRGNPAGKRALWPRLRGWRKQPG